MGAQIQFDNDTGNASLRVSITSELDGQSTELLFNQFPIRIGRNRNNELVLFHEYVSQWHAVVGFVRGQLSILQVGTSNSVRVGPRKMRPNELLPLSGGEEIRVVPFRLNLQLVSVPGAIPQPLPRPPMSYDPLQASPSWNEASMHRATMTAGPQPADEALALVNRLAERFLGRRPADAREVAMVVARIEQVLDICFGFVFEMLHGQNNFYQGFGIPSPNPPGGLLESINKSITNSVQLGSALLSPMDPNILLAMNDAFETLKVHQLAVLRGLEAGVRSLLRRLSPKAVTKQTGNLSRLSGAKGLWETYQQIHADFADEDHQEVFKVVYGSQFRKAYNQVMEEARAAGQGRQSE